ncbi:response regulator transcription factor [Isoptericola halotolerans]|uniref:response regulator transcription factor n=1 Tax=Isoptericola halotolerans TaxID=300560 RepID=UPI00388EEF89
MRVLVAEDEHTLADMIARGLSRQSMAVDVVYRGDHADEALSANQYDVVVLDRDLPGTHGDEVMRRLVQEGSTTRVLMLTAQSGTRERVAGLELGADDYLGKPFDYAELVARVRALARRPSTAAATLLEHDGILVDIARAIATRDGRDLALTPKELMLLAHLLQSADRIVSHEELLEKVWDAATDPFTNAVRVTVSKVRTKLGAPDPIETVHGRGYRMKDLTG